MFAWFILLLLGAIWGASYLFIKVGGAEIPPFTFVAGRTIMAALALMVVMAARKESLPRTRRDWMPLIAMGIFNGVTTWVEDIIRPRGFTPIDAGTVGALMLAGGVIGAVVIPPFSDKQHKRRIYLFAGLLLAIPSLIGVTYAASAVLLFASSFALGFFLVGISPIGIQYAAEITQPTPEGTSNGLIQLFGQASVVFVYIMEATRSADGAFTPSLLLAAGFLVLSVFQAFSLHDPHLAPKS